MKRTELRHDDHTAAAKAAANRAAPAERMFWPSVVQRARADPRALSRAEMMHLQRTIGNRAVGQLLARSRPQPDKTGLPDPLKAGIETLSGLAMDDVKVHYNSSRPAQLQALAYAQGSDIHLAPGEESHLPHEAWHVVQQKQGRARPTLQLQGTAINDDGGLEQEADVAGARLAELNLPRRSALEAPPLIAFPSSSCAVVQREKAKPPQALLAERIASSTEARDDVLKALPPVLSGPALSDEETTDLALYNAARLYGLGVSQSRLPDAYKPFANEALKQVAETVQEVIKGKPNKTELEQAKCFQEYLEKRLKHLNKDPDMKKVAEVIATFRSEVEKTKSAHVLASEYVHHGLKKSIQFGTFLSDESLSAMKNHEGTGKKFIEPVLDNTLTEVSREQRLHIVARGIRDLEALGNAEAKAAVSLLAVYLRNQVSALAFPNIAIADDVGWSLVDDVKQVDEAGQNPKPIASENPLFANIRAAWTIIRKAVSPAVLNRAGPCGIRVYPSRFHRQQYSKNMIEVGSGRNSVSVILHEFGHHLEGMGNATRWVRLHQMLYARAHGELKTIFPVTIPEVISSNEQQYAATMPAWWYAGGWFGYSAKYYPDGGTEVVSTTLEVFDRPERLYQIALRDPELFVAVLGMLRE